MFLAQNGRPFFYAGKIYKSGFFNSEIFLQDLHLSNLAKVSLIKWSQIQGPVLIKGVVSVKVSENVFVRRVLSTN